MSTPILLSHLFIYLSTPSRFFYIFPRLAKERKHVSRKSRKLARYFCRRKRSTYKIRNYADTTMVDYSRMHLTITRRKLAQTNKSRHVCLSQCNLCKTIFIKKLIISETHISGEKKNSSTLSRVLFFQSFITSFTADDYNRNKIHKTIFMPELIKPTCIIWEGWFFFNGFLFHSKRKMKVLRGNSAQSSVVDTVTIATKGPIGFHYTVSRPGWSIFRSEDCGSTDRVVKHSVIKTNWFFRCDWFHSNKLSHGKGAWRGCNSNASQTKSE